MYQKCEKCENKFKWYELYSYYIECKSCGAKYTSSLITNLIYLMNITVPMLVVAYITKFTYSLWFLIYLVLFLIIFLLRPIYNFLKPRKKTKQLKYIVINSIIILFYFFIYIYILFIILK